MQQAVRKLVSEMVDGELQRVVEAEKPKLIDAFNAAVSSAIERVKSSMIPAAAKKAAEDVTAKLDTLLRAAVYEWKR